MSLMEQYVKEAAGAQIAREVAKGTMRTWSGVLVDPLHPQLDTVRIDDIAHALSMVCRYSGHVDAHYSVAQHSIEVSLYLLQMGASPLCQLMGLLHDAEEAYFGDMSSPLKKHYPDYRKHGDAMREFIYDKYIPDWRELPMYEDLVHKADQDLYQIERISMLLPYGEAEELCNKKYGRSVIKYGKEPKEVEAEFLRRFASLGATERVSVEGRGAVSPKSNHERY